MIYPFFFLEKLPRIGSATSSSSCDICDVLQLFKPWDQFYVLLRIASMWLVISEKNVVGLVAQARARFSLCIRNGRQAPSNGPVGNQVFGVLTLYRIWIAKVRFDIYVNRDLVNDSARTDLDVNHWSGIC